MKLTWDSTGVYIFETKTKADNQLVVNILKMKLAANQLLEINILTEIDLLAPGTKKYEDIYLLSSTFRTCCGQKSV